MTVGFHPTLWYNDAGGVTLGVGEREDYLGRFLLNETLLSVATGWGSDEDLRDVDLDLRLRNPLFLRAPNASQTLDLFDVEGRYGATLALDWQRQRHPGRGALWSHGLSVQWVHPDDFRYLDRGYYDGVGTIEVAATTGVADTSGGWGLGLRGSLGGGLVYNRDGLAGTRPTEVDQFYSRATLEATAHRRLTPELAFGARFFAGGAGGDHEAVKQRQIYFQGADPLRLLRNPFLRSRGSLLADDDVRYHAPGGAGVRGADPRLSAGALAGLALELERTLLTRPRRELFSRVGVAGFADLSYALSATLAAFDEGGRFLADAGIGLRAEHRIGETSFVTRLDFPLWFNRPGLAHDRSPDDDELAFRWLVSFQPAF
jgi:hypothetical protein